MKIILILFLSIVISSSVLAEKYFFVGTTFPFILAEKQDGEVYGLGADIIKKIGHRLGHDFVIKIFPFKRALLMIEHGKADVFIGAYKSADREKFMIYTKYAFYQDPMVFYVKKDNPLKWDGKFSSLSGKIIGLTRGWSYGTKFDRYKKNLQTYMAGSVEANFKMLLNDRIDLFICHPRNALVIVNKLNIKEKVKNILPPIIVNKGYFGFSKKRNLNTFLNQFNVELKKMIKNGEIQQLNRKYNLYLVDE